MKTLKLLTLVIFAVSLFNCSKDDSINESIPVFNATNFNKSINENPMEGLVIGTITTSGSLESNFTIISQVPNNAMRIDAASGRLIVEDAIAFDYETSPIITAVVKDLANNTTTNVTINLNNVDDIASFLTTSKADYLAAENSDWVAISEEEYNILSERLNDVSELGTSSEDYQTTDVSPIDNITVTNVGGSPNLLGNNYFFAFKYHSTSNNVVGAQVKFSVSDALAGPFVVWGGQLPEHDMGDNYFVLKYDSAVLFPNNTYVAFHTPGQIGYTASSPDKTSYGANGNTQSFPESNISNGYIYLYQGLSTSQKQWGS